MSDPHTEQAFEAYLLTWKATPLPTARNDARVIPAPKPHAPVVEFLISLGEVGIHRSRRVRRPARAVALKAG